MAKIKELIHWKLLYSVFKGNAEKLITHKTKETLNVNISELNNIANQQYKTNELPKHGLIKEVYDKFKSLETEPIAVLIEHFSRREVRLLVWSLDYKEEDSILFGSQFSKFIHLINEYWRDSYIIPLWCILLNNWNTFRNNKTRFSEYTSLLKNKCDVYDKSRKDVLAIKSYFYFWEKDGLNVFVNYLISNNIKIQNICESLNLNTNLIDTYYYNEGFVLYLKCIKFNDISIGFVQEIVIEIRKITKSKYKLLLLSLLLLENKFSSEVTLTQKVAVDIIGDPIIKRHWSNKHLNQEEAIFVETARKKLIVLMNKDFIDIFFSKLVQDSRRKEYWLKFIDNIENIKFVGNDSNYKNLINEPLIKKYVTSRYYRTKTNQSTCALIIWAKEYVFVEFSDTGALYIYRIETFNTEVRLKHIERITDLKKLPKGLRAVKLEGSNYLNLLPEGTLGHRGDWESRLNVWMNKYFYN
ncbi:EH signature domain-containing protein [Tenacibaculum dicentrarchi]|nr:EH signature domain-containing protein [Tenacibaculum dicentrarchi]